VVFAALAVTVHTTMNSSRPVWADGRPVTMLLLLLLLLLLLPLVLPRA
jgi:hypothetical protein